MAQFAFCLQARARMFSAEVSALQFNVLVTTYEYIMRDRARLSKVRPDPPTGRLQQWDSGRSTRSVSTCITYGTSAMSFGTSSVKG